MRNGTCEVTTATGEELLQPAGRAEACPRRQLLRVEQPLWLSHEETRALISLCFASEASGGDMESQLFSKLGDFFRSFAM
jgi:hypothetical protein